MTRSNIAVRLKRGLVPILTLALAIALATLYATGTTPSLFPEKQPVAAADDIRIGEQASATRGQRVQTATTSTTTSPGRHISDITIIILDGGRNRPLAFKLGGKYIEMPAPSSWPRVGDQETENGRYLAAIIDTADVLQANGFKADDTFGLVLGDTELDAGNTFRIKGNHHTAALGNGDAPAVAYRTQPGEQGIWRALSFKNIVLSHAQVPSLEDHLDLPSSGGIAADARISTPAATANASGSNLASANPHDPSRPQVTPLEEPGPESTRKYVEALDNPDPTVRANAIQALLDYGYREAGLNDNASTAMQSLIAKSLLDKDSTVRSTTMEALDSYEGNLPQGTLSHIALNDSNPALRIQALDLLVERFGAQATATVQEAQNDPDPRVARMAKQLFGEMTSAP